MNIYYYNSEEFKSSKIYEDFINENPSSANLNIRASSANVAVPINNVKIIVSKEIDNNKIIFYEGTTDESGMINKIKLPTPGIITNDLEIPKGTIYNIEATYNNDTKIYKVIMYPEICVVQNINIIPNNIEVDYGN